MPGEVRRRSRVSCAKFAPALWRHRPLPLSAGASARNFGGMARAVHQVCANRETTQMANKITEECINCGACEPECPNQAISEGEDFYTIDAAKCDECAAKGGEHSCKAVCPTECIVQA